jgi:hypothetical protein
MDITTKFPTPLADGLIGHDDPTSEQELFHVTIAETEPEIQPDTVADDLGRKAVILIAVDRWCVYALSMSHRVGTGQVALNKLTMPIATPSPWSPGTFTSEKTRRFALCNFTR